MEKCPNCGEYTFDGDSCSNCGLGEDYFLEDEDDY